MATARGALVAYRDRSDTEVRDIAVLRFEDGKWHGPGFVHADNWQVNACPVNGPALAAVGDRVALAWFTAEGDWLEFVPGASEFRARIVSPDGSREPAFRITASTADRQAGYPRMVRAGKDLIFAWTSTRPTPQVKTAVVRLPG